MAKIKADEMPNLKGLSTGDLIDMLGECRFEKKTQERLEGYLKEALSTRMEIGDEGNGDMFYCVIGSGSKTTLDAQKVRDEMGDDWYLERCKFTEYRKVNVKPIADMEV